MRKFIYSFFVIILLIFVIIALWYHFNPDSLKFKLKKNKNFYHIAKKTSIYWRKLNNPLRKVEKRRKKKQPDKILIRINTKKVVGKMTHFWAGTGNDLFYNNFADKGLRLFYEYIGRLNKRRPAIIYWRSHNMFSDREAPWGPLSGGKIYRENSSGDRKSTRLNSSHTDISRMPSSA